MIARFLLTLYLLMSASSAWAAIAEVGAGSQRATQIKQTSNSAGLAFPGNVTAGDLLLVAGMMYNAGGPPASVTVTDSVSTTYGTKICTAVDTNGSPFIAYGIAPSSGANTVTVNPPNASDTFGWSQDEFSGTHTSAPLDVDGGNTTGSGTTASDDITTGTANALVVGLIGSGSADTHTAGSGYTKFGNDAAALTNFDAQFQVVTTATSYTVNWTSTFNNWTACTISFKVPTAAATRRPVAPLVLQ